MTNNLPYVTPPPTAPATTSVGSTISPEYRGDAGPSFGQGLKALAGSILGGSSGTGLLGGLISGGFNLLSDKLAYNRQKEMYGIQRADALSDYERQRSDYLSDLADERAYNSPEAQVARLKAAGINPNTTFGSGSAANTVSTATNNAGVNPASVPNVTSSPLGSAMISGASGLIQSSLAETQAEEMTSRIELAKAEAIKSLSQSRLFGSDSRYREIEMKYLDGMLSADLNLKRANFNESLARASNLVAQTANTKATTEFVNRQTAMLQLEIDNIWLKFENIASNTSLNHALANKAYQDAIESSERALNLWYKNAEEEFNKNVRDSYGADKTVRDMNFKRWFNPIVESVGLIIDGIGAFFGARNVSSLIGHRKFLQKNSSSKKNYDYDNSETFFYGLD